MEELEEKRGPERWSGDPDKNGPDRWSGGDKESPERWTGDGGKKPCPPPPPEFPVCIAVPVVVGRNTGQVMVVNRIPLTPPAFEIQSINKTVEVEECKVCSGKVIINGTLRKNIIYKTVDGTQSDEFDENEQVCGEVRHCTVWIPFHMFIEVAGAEPGMDCRVENATVECEKDELVEPTEEQISFNAILEKAIIRVDVKVTQTRQLTINVKEPGVCP